MLVILIYRVLAYLSKKLPNFTQLYLKALLHAWFCGSTLFGQDQDWSVFTVISEPDQPTQDQDPIKYTGNRKSITMGANSPLDAA